MISSKAKIAQSRNAQKQAGLQMLRYRCSICERVVALGPPIYQHRRFAIVCQKCIEDANAMQGEVE